MNNYFLFSIIKETLLEIKKQKLLDELNILSDSIAEKNPKNDMDLEASDLVATKCRVFYDCKSTNIKMHNALILGVDSDQDQTVNPGKFSYKFKHENSHFYFNPQS